MKDKKTLHQIKEKILQNLSIIQSTFSRCKDSGLEDSEDILYNKIYELTDKVKNADHLEDLDVLLMEAKDVEQNLEFWISSHGGFSMGLDWPAIPD